MKKLSSERYENLEILSMAKKMYVYVFTGRRIRNLGRRIANIFVVYAGEIRRSTGQDGTHAKAS